MTINLEEIRSVIVQLSKKYIRKFAEEHKEETFYAFGFDLNVEYGDVLLCFNANDAFEETSIEYQEKYDYSKDQLQELRKSTGDWEYQGFNDDFDGWEDDWESWKDKIDQYVIDLDDADKEQEFYTQFSEMCCLAILDLEKQGIFNSIKKTDDFFLLVLDHEEDVGLAEIRLNEARKVYA